MGENKWWRGPTQPHPTDANIALAMSCDNIIKTEDAGKTWFYSGNGYSGARRGFGKNSIAFFKDPKKMLFFHIDYGIYLTEDKVETFRKLPHPRYYGETTPVGTIEPISNPKGKQNFIVSAVGPGGNGPYILINSEDCGNTWRIIPNTEDTDYKFISYHPQKPNIVYARFWKSEDRGKSFTKKLQKKVDAMYEKNGDIVYSIDSNSKRETIILKSIDGGETWENSYNSIPINSNLVFEMVISPEDPDNMFLATERGLYVHKKGNWILKGEESGLLKDKFGTMTVGNVCVDPTHANVVYVSKWCPWLGHSNGIFRSEDYGETWKNITYNLGPEMTAWAISVSPNDGYVYIGTSHGSWKLSPPY